MTARTREQRALETLTRTIGKAITAEMNDLSSGPPLGFFLMVFDFGKDGFCSYISNAQRADMIKVLREQADRLEAGTADTAGDA